MQKVVLVTGGFDPIHSGHIEYFKAARELGDHLTVGVNSDAWLERKKGKAFMSFAERSEILEAFQYVDEVMAFKDDAEGSAINLLTQVQQLYPNCTIAFANGGDRTNKNTPEQGFCNAYNIDMIWNIGGGKIQSSSELLEKANQL